MNVDVEHTVDDELVAADEYIDGVSC